MRFLLRQALARHDEGPRGDEEPDRETDVDDVHPIAPPEIVRSSSWRSHEACQRAPPFAPRTFGAPLEAGMQSERRARCEMHERTGQRRWSSGAVAYRACLAELSRRGLSLP